MKSVRSAGAIDYLCRSCVITRPEFLVIATLSGSGAPRARIERHLRAVPGVQRDTPVCGGGGLANPTGSGATCLSTHTPISPGCLSGKIGCDHDATQVSNNMANDQRYDIPPPNIEERRDGPRHESCQGRSPSP